VEGWQAFWSNPSAEVAHARLPTVLAPEVTATWPRRRGRVRGVEEYAERITAFLALVPDLRVEKAEHAAAGDVTFIRWVARGTGPDGPFEGIGTDRMRVGKDGRVVETLVMSDMPIFEALARATAG